MSIVFKENELSLPPAGRATRNLLSPAGGIVVSTTSRVFPKKLTMTFVPPNVTVPEYVVFTEVETAAVTGGT